MHKNVKPSRFKVSALAIALAMLPFGANAAGLGKLSVLSAIGQPLRAELDISATKEEIGSLTVRVAPPEAFNQAGIQYVPVLSGVAFVLDKRRDGRPYYRITSDRPVNEPFLDMLVELNWASGRLVREYTFLLDPPEAFQKQPPIAPAVVVPEVKREQPAAAAADQPPSEPRRRTPVADGKASAKKQQPISEVPPKAARKPVEGNERAVKPGETLGKIAAEFRPEGISLDQMLLALFRNNEDAFIEGNMNRLKAGKILKVPSPEDAAAVDAGEARKTVVAQAADFNAYRRRLAAAVAGKEATREEAPKQAVAGKITPKVEDKAPVPAPGKDKLEVSRTESAHPGAKAGKSPAGAVAEEDRIAKEKALKEANVRIAELEKNLADLKKLAEMKSAAGAKMQEQVQAAKPVAEPAKPEPAPAKPAETGKPADAAKPAETEKPAETAKSEEAPKPVEAAEPAPKKPAPPPPPPPEPSFIEDNPEIVFGGGGIVALLLGYLGFSAWRKKKAAAKASGGSELSPTSAFGTTAGEASTTGDGAVLTDFSQAGPGALGADEGVDPVAEADVYMAYGREAQAEEILIEALKTDPTRHAIYLKLLELYSKRKSAKQFETLAREFRGLTGGTGADWEKAAAMGLALDPANPLYGGEAPAAPEAEAEAAPSTMDATFVGMPEGAPTVIDVGGMPTSPEAEASVPEEETSSSLDFDLDLGAPQEAAAAVPEEAAAVEEVVTPPKAEDEAMSLDFDLDLGAPAEAASEAPVGASPAIEIPDDGNAIDFELGSTIEPALPEVAAEAAPEIVPEAPTEESAGAGGLDFEFDLGTGAEPAAPVAEAAPAPALDLSSITLDLDAPLPEPEQPPAASEPEAPIVADNPEVGTKLELAIAYEEMGDKEGARELLQEVLNEGSPAQQATARDKLARLEG